MLQIMHDKIQGLVAWVVAIVIALAFSLWGIQNYLHGGATHVMAKVNGKEITQEQFRAAYEQAKRLEMMRLGTNFSLDQKSQAEFKKDVLQQLIKQEVLMQAQTEMGFGLSKRQLWSIVSSQPIFQVNGRFSLGNFQQIVQRMFYSEQAFFDGMKSSILRMQLDRGVAGSSFVLPNEVEFIKQIAKQRRDFGYFVVSSARFAGKVQINLAAIKNYYEQHQKEFLLPEKISIQYIELSSSDLQNKIKPTTEQLKQFYQSHIDSFSTPKKWQVTRVLLPLPTRADEKVIENAKKKLESIAVQLQDKKVMTNMGPDVRVSTSWMMHNEIPQDIATQLDKLDIGQIAKPFRTKDGYNLVKVLAKQEQKITPYDSIVAKVKTVYEHQQLAQDFSQASDRLSDLVYTNPDSLEPAAKEFGLKIKETGLVTRDGSKDGVLANNKILTVAFSDAVLKQRYNSNLIEVGAGKVLILRIKDYVPEKSQPLEQVQNIITEKLRLEEARKMAANLVGELLQALLSGKNESDLAHQHGLVWSKLSGAKYRQSGVDAKLIDAVFALPKPTSQSVAATKVELDSGYAILRLDRVYDDAAAKVDSKVDDTIKSLSEIFGQFDYQTLLNTFMDQSKIEIIDKAENPKIGTYE